ncbi:MAG: hypothetical protein F6K19_25960 [Cyanothece sp. SIO1E1]|nr:hypothetical protein [Cyanothece sp. SIO1E1]
MDLSNLVVQLVIAIICAGTANLFLGRQIPGKLAGLILIGLAGVWVGDWGAGMLKSRYGIDFPFLHWQIQDVSIIPAIFGSAIVLYLVTTALRWGRYGN